MILGYHGFSNWSVRKVENDAVTAYTFGFELEVQRKQGSVWTCDELVERLEEDFGDLFVYERDGSIGEGVEIISQPMTWAYFQENLPLFKKLLKDLDHYNYQSHNGGMCGLHIHVGKVGLGLSCKEIDVLVENDVTETEIQKQINQRELDTIINIQYILEKFQKEIYAFSRRKNTRWAKPLTELEILENGLTVIDKKQIDSLTTRYLHSCSGDRYMNLNLTNEKTIEFRMFRGTLKWETFYFSINLVKNIIDFAKVSNNVVTFKNLVLSKLSEEEQQQCIQYCISRNIDLDNKSILTLKKMKKKKSKEKINTRELFQKIICELD